MSDNFFSSPSHFSDPIHVDPVNRLYEAAMAVHYLAGTLPETEAGLARLLASLGNDVRCCAELLDDRDV